MIHIFYSSRIRPKGSSVEMFSFLASQEILRLLYVSAMTFKEAKRMFLTL
jgi:hypothetical protein